MKLRSNDRSAKAWFAAACSIAAVVSGTAAGTPGAQPRAAAATATPAAAAASQELNPRLLRRFQALRPGLDSDPSARALTDLGRLLYYDPRLSRTQSVSCNNCHPLDTYGATDESTSTGIRGQKGSRNAPTTYNAARHFTQFWDGREPNVEEQAKKPILNPVEMGMDGPEHVVAVMKSIPGYAAPFRSAFPGQADPVTYDNIGIAIGAFERGLVTPSRWDRYLSGDRTALSEREKEGVKLFANIGCLVCHTGEMVGGSMYEKVGAAVPWPNQADQGRAAITHHVSDGMMFKVPSLRNVLKTPPYFHDGSAATIDEAVRMMATHQLDIELTDDETEDLVAWLGALTGELPRSYIRKPELPANGPNTPKPIRH